MEKKLLAVVFAALFFAGCIAQGFDAGYEKARQIRARYVSGEQFLPESERELFLLEKELSALRNEASNTALIDFLGIELAKVEMQLFLVRGTAKLQMINLSSVDCPALEEGLENLGRAEASGTRALERMKDFQKQHPGEFLKIDLERERVSSLVLSIQDNIAFASNLKQLGC
jgi:hypothetical protein